MDSDARHDEGAVSSLVAQQAQQYAGSTDPMDVSPIASATAVTTESNAANDNGVVDADALVHSKEESNNAGPAQASLPSGLSSATTEILARMSAPPPVADYTVAREHILKSIVTSDNLPSLPPTTTNARGRGRPRSSTHDQTTNGTLINQEVKSEALETPLKVVSTTPAFKGSARGGKREGFGRGRGGKKAGKRKRADSEISSLTDSEVEALKHGNGANGMNEPKVTKSGRAVHRPTQFVPVQPSPTAASASAQKKRKRSTRNPENAVCKSCERGHSPDNNAIVFCDSCGTPYHQYCHTPPIEKEFIEIAEKEWFCIECSGVPVELPADFSRLISSSHMSDVQKRAIFAQLSHAQLIDVLIHATILQPSLAILPPPSTAMNGLHDHLEPGAELPYDGYETDPPAHYPKPGNGLARTLPPESEHLDWLLDDNTEVFSHVINNTPSRVSNGTNGWHLS